MNYAVMEKPDTNTDTKPDTNTESGRPRPFLASVQAYIITFTCSSREDA